MQALVLDIKGETAADDITIVFALILDGGFFPSNSAYEFHAQKKNDIGTQFKVTGTFDAPATGDMSFLLPTASTMTNGVYNYRIKEIVQGGAIRTPARGVLELIGVPDVP